MSGWRFDKVFSLTKYFHESTELNGSNYVKVPIRSSATLNFEIDDRFGFLCSVLAHLHPCKNSHPFECEIIHKKFFKLNNDGFDFTSGFKSNAVHRKNKLNRIPLNMDELVLFSK